jgi:hypothetical protein
MSWLRGVWAQVGLRDLHFYGGLVLVGWASGRWDLVGAVLVVHGALAPLLRRGGST